MIKDRGRRCTIVGVMGGAGGSLDTIKMARELGQRIADKGWIMLNGGRNAGVMAASAQGANEAGGITIGILPDKDAADAAPHIQIPIPTGMGSARNQINVLAANIVIACPGGPGTISEVALALKYDKPVICLGWHPGDLFQAYEDQGQLQCATTPAEAIGLAAGLLPSPATS